MAGPHPNQEELCRPLRHVGDVPQLLRFRVPQARGAPAEALLASANAHARSLSLARLSKSFPGLEIASIAQTTDDNRFTAFDVEPATLAALDGLAVIDDLLAYHDLPSPRLTFARGGEARHFEPPVGAVIPSWNRYAITRAFVGPFAAALEQGFTAVFNSADQYHDRIAALCEDLDRALGTRCNINAYLSYGQAEGFGPHWDDHDVLILPIVGTKEWEIHEPACLAPLRGAVDETTTGRVVWSGPVGPGRSVYIPRGWGHSVKGKQELTLHFTLGLGRQTGTQVLQFLARQSVHWPLFRGDVPQDPQAKVFSYQGSLYDDSARFAEAVHDLGSAQMVDHAIAHTRANILARPRHRFSTTFAALHSDEWNDVVVRMSVPGGVMIGDGGADSAVEPDSFVVAVGARMLVIAEHVVPALARLAEGEALPVRDLCVDCPHGPDCASLFARALVSTGVAHVVDPDIG